MEKGRRTTSRVRVEVGRSRLPEHEFVYMVKKKHISAVDVMPFLIVMVD